METRSDKGANVESESSDPSNLVEYALKNLYAKFGELFQCLQLFNINKPSRVEKPVVIKNGDSDIYTLLTYRSFRTERVLLKGWGGLDTCISVLILLRCQPFKLFDGHLLTTSFIGPILDDRLKEKFLKP